MKQFVKISIVALTLVCLIGAISEEALAGVFHWKGGTKATVNPKRIRWTEPLNWVENAVPTASDTVIFTDATVAGSNQDCELIGDVTVKRLEMGYGSTFSYQIKVFGNSVTVTDELFYGSGTLTTPILTGNLTVTGGTPPAFNLTGSSLQTVSTTVTLPGLTLNNAAGAQIGTATITTLTLTNGELYTTGTVTATTVNRTNGWVKGNLARSITAPAVVTFAVGDGEYAPVDFNATTGTGTVTVKTTDGTPAGIGFPAQALSRSFTLDAPGFDAAVTMYYTAGDVNGDESLYMVGLHSDSAGAFIGMPGIVDVPTHTIQINGTELTGTWSAAELVALPIGLTTFDGVVAANTVSLTWSTMTEQNNLGFYVERRIEGASVYQTVSGLIAGAGTSMEQQDYSYTDANVAQGTYYYRLKQMDQDGGTSYSQEVKIVVAGALGVAETRPTEYSLGQNYPNPFNPSTQIAFALPEQGIVTLKVFNLIGQEVASLVNGVQYQAGSFNAQLDASQLSSGVYYYRLSVDGLTRSFTSMKKMMLVK